MPNYDKKLDSSKVAGSGIVPDDIASEVIKEAPKASTILTRARTVRLSRKKTTQPVLDVLPEAYWVNGETGLKQTTDAGWKGLSITAEELATIVVIPDALVDDSDINLWEEVKPYIAQAMGRALDAAVIFGVNKPNTFPTALFDAAQTAGNNITQVTKGATKKDLAAAVAELGEKLSSEGYSPNGFAARPGLDWRLRSMRGEDGHFLFVPPADGGEPRLFGYPLTAIDNGAWDGKADLLMADWSKFIVGVRQDITYKVFEEGVITNDEGKVLFNLMQQDAKALRVVFRVGFQVSNPATALRKPNSFPAGFVLPAAG